MDIDAIISPITTPFAETIGATRVRWRVERGWLYLAMWVDGVGHGGAMRSKDGGEFRPDELRRAAVECCDAISERIAMKKRAAA